LELSAFFAQKNDPNLHWGRQRELLNECYQFEVPKSMAKSPGSEWDIDGFRVGVR
jgi:hypothetical protein